MSKTKEPSFKRYFQLIENNKTIKYPKRFINTKKIIPVEFKICVVKKTEPDDKFRTIRDEYGKTFIEKPIQGWTILSSEKYNIEETFWIYGMHPKANRPTIGDVIKKLVTGAHKKEVTKQIIVVYNKLIIYNEEQFDMVICKCTNDAQRLHHVLQKISKKQKINSLLFMGTATPATASRMYDIIKEKTNWPIRKIRRTSTRP